jgi:CRISPR-associated exonuclease Cas4
MTNKYRYSRKVDVDEQYITPTDVKQYVFCPRVTYFTRVMRLKPIMGSQQEAGKEEHNHLSDLEKRRASLLKSNFGENIKSKEYDVTLISDELNLSGKLDMLVITEDNEYIPVEFKNMTSQRRQIHLDHKYQVSTLALLIEMNHDCIVRRGIIHYLKDDRTIQLPISQRMKARTKTYLERIMQLLQNGIIPSPKPICRHQQIGCGFADQCIDT